GHVAATHGSHFFSTDSPQNAQRENQSMGLKVGDFETIDGFLHGATPIRPALPNGDLSHPRVKRSEEHILILIGRARREAEVDKAIRCSSCLPELSPGIRRDEWTLIRLDLFLSQDRDRRFAKTRRNTL